MDKILSIIIPSYNMEALLPTCLDSLCGAKSIDMLDIIVVNDGSKDNTLGVARGYAAQHGDSIRVIDKPNGNYGSTINAALPVAQGRYVKILDADDRYDTAALDMLVGELKHTTADIVVTPFAEIRGGKAYNVGYNSMGRTPYDNKRLYALDDILPDGYIRYFLMHGVAYLTDMLRAEGYRQTEGLSYTDLEWVTYPMFYAQTVVFLPHRVYLYNLDREGQTMDPAVLARHAKQLVAVTHNILDYYLSHDSDTLSQGRKEWLQQYFQNRVRVAYKLYLIDMPRDMFTAAALSEAERLWDEACRAKDLHPTLRADNKIIPFDYIAHWHKHHCRAPRAIEVLNTWLDTLAHMAYDLLRRHA